MSLNVVLGGHRMFVAGKELLKALLVPCECGHAFNENERAIVRGARPGEFFRVCPDCKDRWRLIEVVNAN